MAAERLRTPLTQLLGCEHPVMLAGMFSVAGHKLCAAVSNAGGFGNIGGLSYTPKMLRKEISLVKSALMPGMNFGVDLLLPKVGEGARKTNYDYTKGKLAELLDVIIEEKVKLFTCAVGVPPKWAVDKLHAAGVVVMNMVGAPSHVQKALDVGVDIICAQGTEAGGHTGDIATMPLIPQCVDICRGKTNYFGLPVLVVAAGGIYDGRGLAAALSLGAAGAWVGTRFICSDEAAASPIHKQRVVEAGASDTTRTLVLTGRPARVLRTPYIISWEERPDEMKKILNSGQLPFQLDLEAGTADLSSGIHAAMGQCAGGIKDVLPAKTIIDNMVQGAVSELRRGNGYVIPAKL